MVEALNASVSGWTGKGIRVYGFLMPSCREMVELEERDSGFDHGQFVQDFEKAGGIWIDMDPCRYDSFDGSHLGHAALQFSRDLAERIHELEPHGLMIRWNTEENECRLPNGFLLSTT